MRTETQNPAGSQVERRALEQAGRPLQYPPRERVGVIVVESFPALGTLAALRFIEWSQRNPEGVIALPTGKTPEFFIREVNRFLTGWKQKTIARELAAGGVDPAVACDLRGMRFVQIDEFYPIDPEQHNSFNYYVRHYYIDGFGLDPARALLIDGTSIGLSRGHTLDSIWGDDSVDLSLRYRMPATAREQLQQDVIRQVDEWCTEYEARIRALGGIGFFLGGIGPDGHIGFNVRGSDLYSTTRLSPVNYETQAAAATDLGGIEVARKRLVITIGLSTITYNPDCTAIIIAAGEAKANIVRDAIENERHVRYPATSLQVLPNARFYLTKGAARNLGARQLDALVASTSVSEAQIEKVVIDLALATGKKIESLSDTDFKGNAMAAALLEKGIGNAKEVSARVARRLRDKLDAGSAVTGNQVFLHTEPHHDDLALGCLPFIVRHIREHSTQHHFVTLTSGFTAVTNAFMLAQVQKLRGFLESAPFAMLESQGCFDHRHITFRNRDVWRYLDGVAAESRAIQDEGEMRRLYRNLTEIYPGEDRQTIGTRVAELIHYFENVYPGKKDPDHIQRLKGMCREWEAECYWGYFGWNGESVHHLRLGFYTGNLFTDEPTVARDVAPILELLREVKPDVITLALDPEASGPDTHYKALQAISESLRLYQEENGGREITVLGYRNVWYRFHPGEADLFVPVSLNMFALEQSAFMHTFISQKAASFPSPDHDGPFSELAQKIQVDQYQMLKTCMGTEFFYEHPSALIRATRGMVLLKRMTLAELRGHSRELKLSTENI